VSVALTTEQRLFLC